MKNSGGNRMNKKWIWIGIVVILILVGFLVPKLLPDTGSVTASVEVKASPRTVYAQLNDFRNWQLWSAWIQKYSPDEAIYGNGGIGAGAQVSFPSDEGTFIAVMVKSEPHRMVETAIDNPGSPFSVHHVEIRETNGNSLVTWSMGFKNSGWRTLFNKAASARKLKKSLEGLQDAAELWENQAILLVEPGLIESFPYISIRRQISYDVLSENMSAVYDRLLNAAVGMNVRVVGSPYAIYHSVGEERVDVECGFPVSEVVAGQDSISAGIFEEKECVMLDFTGDFSRLEEGHSHLQEWIRLRGFSLAGSPMEIYESSGEDSTEWLTRICYPVTFEKP